jgi:fatty acid desaturase (delta-4 desaturase)
MAQWATFPFLQVAFQLGDMDAILGGRTKGATMYGARTKDQAAVVAGKLAHFGLLLGVPWLLHGFGAAAIGAAAYTASQVCQHTSLGLGKFAGPELK